MDTFGFRGEALSSLTALGELVVTTATKEQAPRGTRLEYDADGKLVSRSAVARSVSERDLSIHTSAYSIVDGYYSTSQQSLSFLACASTRIQAPHQARIYQSIIIIASLCIDITKHAIDSNKSRITWVSFGI